MSAKTTTQMSRVALFIIVKQQKDHKCPLANERTQQTMMTNKNGTFSDKEIVWRQDKV